MPAILTLGGIALAVLGVLITIAGLPDRAAGLGLGSDLIQAGASIFAGGLIISALGVVLKALRDVADRVEEAGFGLSAARPSLNDELADETPMPLPRANSRGAAPATQDELPEAPPAPAARNGRAPREPQPVRGPRDTQPAVRASRPAQPEAARPQLRQEPNFEQPHPDEELADEFPPQRQDPKQQPRWMRAQADANNRQQQAGVIPLQTPRQNRATPTAPANPPRREPAPTTYEAEPRRRPAPQPEPELEEMEQGEPTVVRSGIIGGMAYTLYSDGSIEAELPAGTVRFGSLQELQEHVKRAGVDDQDGDYRGPTAAQH